MSNKHTWIDEAKRKAWQLPGFISHQPMLMSTADSASKKPATGIDVASNASCVWMESNNAHASAKWWLASHCVPFMVPMTLKDSDRNPRSMVRMVPRPVRSIIIFNAPMSGENETPLKDTTQIAQWQTDCTIRRATNEHTLM